MKYTKEVKREYDKKWRKRNKNSIKKSQAKYYQKNKEKILKYHEKYQEEHREKYNENSKKWRLENYTNYSKSHRKSRRIYMNKYNKERRLKDISFRLNLNIGCAISSSLCGEKRWRKWQKLLGYTINDLIKHIEKQFEPWMNWDNYGKWHIDHIKPKSLFSFNVPEDSEFKECWSLSNLQPLEAIKNIKKSNHYVEER